MKPLLYFDIEATGLEPASDRIVSLAVVIPDRQFKKSWLFNPGFPMSEEVIAVHGITDAMVADAPLFEMKAMEIFELFEGCDLVGYNLRNLDLPLLSEEFTRSGIEWDLSNTLIIDASGIFRKKEPRDLSAALAFYCDQPMENAHDAMADTMATLNVLVGQLRRYPDLRGLGRAELAKFSHEDDRVDLAGKIRRDAKGRVVYGFGKMKGVPVADDPGYGDWMCRQSWITSETKRVLIRILDEIEGTTSFQ